MSLPPLSPPVQQALSQVKALIRAGETAAAARALAPVMAAAPRPQWFELGRILHRTGELEQAEAVFRHLSGGAPGDAPAALMLGAVLIDAGRADEAETVLRDTIPTCGGGKLEATLRANLGMALRRQRKDAQALAEYDRALALDPALPEIALHRAEALQNLERHEDALRALEDELTRAPADARLHHHYNDLLYRLGRDDAYLKSYDRAPQSREIRLGKAFFLDHQKRAEESLGLYRALLAEDSDDIAAAMGAGHALAALGRRAEAAAAFEAVLARHPDAGLFSAAAENALLLGDPQKAAALCQAGLMLAPHHQMSLATLSTVWRLMGDDRAETLNGYDTLIRSFELEPPEGFSDMESFNTALNAELDRLHPRTREFVNQSLRGGTQTPDHLFGAGLPLVKKLRRRIDEAVARYIAGLQEDARHPFLSRRSRGFGYAGSWSSRLRDRGFHVNHIHSDGWISSCYYVAVPDAVRDEQGRQGWIKFGEPSAAVGLENPVRRAIQPAPGRLVLFPSYMWHGTVPFHDTAARTTIAFDVIPKA